MNILQKHSENQKIVTLTPSNTVFEAAQKMTEYGVGSVIVLEGDVLVGIFTERDLLNRVVAKGYDPQKIILKNVMTSEVATVDFHDTLQSSYEKMQKTKARHLPIVQDNRVVGIVTMRNLLEYLWKQIEEENAHLKQYIQQT